MKRNLNFSTVIRAAGFAKYLPLIIFQMKNWGEFMSHYAGVKNGGGEYVFRNGIMIKTKDAVSTATIAVIFIKKDYGDMPSNSVVIDIGANIGAYSIFAAMPENNTVYSYEPMPENFDLLKENIRINNLGKKIFPFNFGVSSRREMRRLYLGDSPFHSFLPANESPFNSLYSATGPSKQEFSKINCLSLKDIFDENNIPLCNLLKMDCEGAEYEILYNTPDEYFKRIKEIRLEYHNHSSPQSNDGEHLKSFLEKKGFTVKKFKKGSEHQGDLWLCK